MNINRIKTPYLLLAAALGGFALGWLLLPRGDTGHAGLAAPEDAAAAAETVWTCSMHPQVRQPDFGLCPICAMDLIPVALDADGDDDRELPRLRLSERSIALMNIQTAPVQRAAAAAEVRLPGRIAVDETRRSVMAARFPGRVEQLHADFTGIRVGSGDPLADLYSPELFGVQEEYLQALRRGRPDDPTTAASRDKLILLGLTEAQVDELSARGEASTRVTLHAPAAGTVTARLVTTGEYVETGAPLYELTDLSRLWVELEAFESELSLLEVGQEAEVSVLALPGEPFTARVEFVDTEVDAASRTTRVRLSVDNPAGRLKPGMLAAGVIRAPAAQDPLVIPATAPLFTGARSVVYVRVDAEPDRPVFEARKVALGARMGDVYPVLDGLAEGERVVTHGQFKIDSELQIRGRPSMMAPDPGGDGPGAVPADPRDPPVLLAFAGQADPDFAGELIPLFEALVDFTEALAADDPAAAATAMGRAARVLAAIGPHRLAGEAHLSWMDHYSRIMAVAYALDGTADIAAQRARLQELTLAAESVHVNFGSGGLPVLYRAFCPMVDGDQIGTWLQRGQLIANPYWGSGMLRCGEVIGELGKDPAP